MKTYLDCIPCIVRQTLDAVRLVTSDETIQERVLREVLRASSEMDLNQTPPEMAQWIHRRIRAYVDEDDPYRQIKDQFNRLALGMYPMMQTWIEKSDHRMETAVRLAIAGNIIDFGVNSHLTKDHVCASVTDALSCSLEGDIHAFCDAIDRANRILYLTDNAGEIVFDRLLIEQMPLEKMAAAVRGFPIINDATMQDAIDAGITDLVHVITNGSDAPGTILDTCSEEFLDAFHHADLIIAKGQGNYETLSAVDQNIYFLLKVKCAVIARDIGRPVGSLVLQQAQGCPIP